MARFCGSPAKAAPLARRHPDFVTAVVAHPQDDRLFLSGSIEGRVRLWNIAEQCIVDDAAVHEMVGSPWRHMPLR